MIGRMLKKLRTILATNQVTLTSAAAAVKVPTSAALGRNFVRWRNTHATAVVYFGASGVDNTTGDTLGAGQVLELDLTAAQDVYFYQNSGGNVVISCSEWD